MAGQSGAKGVRWKPTRVTVPGCLVAQDHQQLASFIWYISNLAGRADDMREAAAKAMLKISTDAEEIKRYEDVLAEGEVHVRQLRAYRRLIVETLLSRAVDAFLTYISGLLALIFRTRPETLRSAETVKLEEVLRHRKMADLVDSLAEQRVHDLSYKGTNELAGYLSDRLGFHLFEEPSDLARVSLLVEMRNLIVHNRGVVNRIFLARAPGYSGEIGQPLDLDGEVIRPEIEFLIESALTIDRRAAHKYKLKTHIPTAKCGFDVH